MKKINPKVETYISIAFISLLVLGAFWQLTLMQGYIITDDIFTSDIMNEGFPYRYSLSEALKAGDAPLWISNIYGGFPLLARAEAGICYPVNLILFWLFSPYTALNLVLLVTIITAGVSAYLYLREIRASSVACIIGAVAFSFSGYLLSHLKHLSNINSACWLPLGLFFIERAIIRRDNRYLIWLGIVFGVQQLAGHTQVAYYSGVMYIFYFIFRLFHENKESAPTTKSMKFPVRNGWKRILTERRILIFFGMLFLGSLLGAIQLIPTYELVSLSQRSGGVTFDYASNYAYDPRNLLTFIYPYINGDIGNGTYTGSSIFWEDYGYVGIVTLLMALIAVIRSWKKWHVKFFTITALTSIIFVLGPGTPVYKWAFDFIPGMNYFRFPTRFLLITDFSLIVLAGIGVTYVIEKYYNKKKNRSLRLEFIILAVVILDLLYYQLRQNPIVDAEKWLQRPESVNYLQKDTTSFRIFCVGGNEAHIRTFQRARGWEGNLQPFIDQREYIQPSSNVLYGLQSSNGYANLTPNYIVDVWGDQNRAGVLNQTARIQGDRFLPTEMFWRLMDIYNVKYITSLWEIQSKASIDSIGRFGEAFMYRNNNMMPRAYLVGKLKKAESQNQSLKFLFSNDFDPHNEAIVYDIPEGFKQSDSIGGQVEITKYRRNEVVMNVKSDGPGLLVFSDSYYPGWVAEIDGREETIYRTNLTQRGVTVPGGSHTVKFKFVPKTVTYGIGTTMGALLLFVVLIFFNRHKKYES
jgi:Bacterial membrane protein YfhO